MIFAGGAESEHWSQSSLFDAMQAMSSNFNDTPEKASRAYDKDRDGFVIASGEGSERAMCYALDQHGSPIDYLNTHATSTPAGDCIELDVVDRVFDGNLPLISGTKSLTGHSLGAAGAHEAIYSVLMLQNNFVASSANIEELDPNVGDKPIVRSTIDQELTAVMSNSFGFGGTNVSLIFSKYEK